MADEAAASRSGSADYRWQSQGSGAAPAVDRGARRRTWLFVLAALFLALLAVAIVWILLLKPPVAPPFYLSINIGEYDARQYPNIPFTKQDGDRLKRHFPGATFAETKTKQLLRKELAGLADKTGPVIVEINALAIARDSKVFLLPGDADPGDEGTWFDVRDVLTAVGNCKSEQKLLILDLAHTLTDARIGVVTDRVAETLEEILNSEKPNFHVLCPTSAGQLSLASEALQGSVLGYYFDQGLQGAADADKDLQITVKELFQFLEARVDRWAHNNRAVRQKPRLFGKAADFTIASISGDTPGLLEKAELEAYPDRLQKEWQRRDDWWDKEAFRRAPRLFKKLNTIVMRQEKLWRGGAQKKDIASLDDDTQTIAEKIKRAMTVRNAPPRSLALALMQAGVKDEPAVVDGILDIFTRIKDSSAKKDINAKVAEELVKKLQEPKEVSYPQQASAIVEALCRVPRLHADHLRVSKEALAALKPKRQYAEVLYVERLIGLADRKDVDNVQWQKVQESLQALRVRESIVALLDREPEALSWLDADLKDADALRRLAEEKLLWRGKSTWDDAFEKLQVAKKKYENALAAFNTLRESRWHLDLATAALPAYMELLCDWPVFDVSGEQSWTKAAEEAERVQAFFAAPPEPGAALATDDAIRRLDAHSRDLRRHLQDLADRLERRVNLAKKDETPEALDQLLILLECPLLKAPERIALFARHRAIAAKLNDENEKLDKADNEASRFSSIADATRRSDTSAGLARVRMSLALLRLGRFDMKGKVVPIPTGDSKPTPQEWTAIERKLQEFWTIDLPKYWHSAKPGFQADALNRLVSPWELERRAGDVEREPSRIWQEQIRTAFLRWLQERYRSEATSVDTGGQDRQSSVFFSEAAEELRLKGIDPD
jgi:hypothetical protein